MRSVLKWVLPTGIAVAAGLCFCSAGCSKQPDAKTELERAATELAKPEPVAAPAATPAQTPAPATAPRVATEAPAPPASQQMGQAMGAYKAGNLEDAVTRLQRLRATPTLSPQQRMALNDAMGAVMGEIYALAAKGDGRAIAAVKQYEYMQTHR